jgi:hypothetical protein
MTGLPEFNFPAFNAMAAHLRSLGFEVLNPAERGLHLDLHWSVCMRHALRQLLAADSIILLNGWKKSRGARLESVVSRALDMTRYHEGIDFL